MVQKAKIVGMSSMMMGFNANLMLFSVTMDSIYIMLGFASAGLPVILNARRLLVEVVEWYRFLKSKTSVDEWKDEFRNGNKS